MVNLAVKHQEHYSRGSLLLRSFLGWIYIFFPHAFMLGLFGIWSNILLFMAFWVMLFTGRYPKSWFDFQVGMHRWGVRYVASLMNLTDEYPAFGIKPSGEAVTLEVPYTEHISRLHLLLKTFFGFFFVGIPHGFCLFFRMIATQFLVFLAWWAVLFTGKYPQGWHEFNVGSIRWGQRVGFYLLNITDSYPLFSGKP